MAAFVSYKLAVIVLTLLSDLIPVYIVLCLRALRSHNAKRNAFIGFQMLSLAFIVCTQARHFYAVPTWSSYEPDQYLNHVQYFFFTGDCITSVILLWFGFLCFRQISFRFGIVTINFVMSLSFK